MTPPTPATGRAGRGEAALVRAYLLEDDYHAAGRMIRECPQLLGERATLHLRRTATRGPEATRALAAQHLRFLERCRADPAVVFPPNDPIIDPTCFALVADRHAEAERAEARFDAADSPGVRSACATAWVTAWESVLAEPALGSAHPALLAALLNDAARAQFRCFMAAGGLPRLSRARAWFEQAVLLTPATSSRAASRRSNLGLVLMELAEHAATPHSPDSADERDAALRLLRDAAAAAVPGTPGWTDCRVRLALGRLQVFWDSGKVRQLDAAVRELTPVIDARVASVDAVHALGVLLRQRYSVRGRADELDLAVTMLIGARDATPPQATERLRRQLDLGVALLDRHAHGADPADLSNATEALREAAASAPAESPDRPAVLAHSAICSYRMFQSTGSLMSLAVATDLARQAADSPAARTGERASWLANLAAIVEETARQSGDLALLDDALATYADALDAGPVIAIRWAVLTGLGSGRRDRFSLSRNPDDLDAAVQWLEAAASQIPPKAPDSTRAMLALAQARFERHVSQAGTAVSDGEGAGSEHGGDLLDSLRAVRALARRRVPQLDRQRIRATRLALTLAAQRVGLLTVPTATLRRQVRRIWADAARLDPEMVMWTGSLWARWAVSERRWSDAALGYRIAVDAVHELARRQADRRQGAWWVRSGGELACEAAYAGALARRPREGVRLMETARVVLLTDTLMLGSMRSAPGADSLPGPLLDRLDAAMRRLRAAESATVLPGVTTP